MDKILTGKVVEIIDEYNIVINIGSEKGIENYARFLIYNIGKELTDPDTNESLGCLEIVCGEGKVSHIQDKMTILTSAKEKTYSKKRIVKSSGLSPLFGTTEEIYEPESTIEPFKDVAIGSLVKQIR